MRKEDFENYCENGKINFIDDTFICVCNKGFSGKFCEYKENDDKKNKEYINDTVKIIEEFYYNVDEDDIVNTVIINPNLLINVETINDMYKEMNLKNEFKKFVEKKISDIPSISVIEQKKQVNFIDITSQAMNEYLSDSLKRTNKTKKKLHEFIQLSLTFAIYQDIKSKLKQRNLDASDYTNSLVELIKKCISIDSINYFEDTSYNLTTTSYSDNYTYYNISILADNAYSYLDYKRKNERNKNPFINLEDYDVTKINHYILHLYFDEAVSYGIELSSKVSKINKILVYDKNYIKTYLNNIGLNIPSIYDEDELLKKGNYKFYSKKIDVFNPIEIAFTNPCYKSIEFDYDLPQKYRKKKVYSGYTFKSSSKYCKYEYFDTNTLFAKFSCQYSDIDNIKYSFELEPLENHNIDPNEVINIPTNCANQIEEIYKNCAFWFLTILIFILVIIDIVGYILIKNMSSDTILLNSEFSTEKLLNDSDASDDENNNNNNNPDFAKCLLKNLKLYHPLSSIFHPSIYNDYLYSTWILFFNIFMYFGFNALYYFENKIAKKINRKSRNDFSYPFIKEFDKITYSILSTMAVTIVARLIVFLTYNQKLNFENNIKDNGKDGAIKNLNCFLFIRRLISATFMLILITFFYYYCIVFCGIYIHSQAAWFYSGLWTLFWVYLAFCPLYILIITVFETSNSESIVYCMKRVFIF